MLNQSIWSMPDKRRDEGCSFPGALSSKVPITFRARKAICETSNRLLWKAGLLTCFKGNKKKNYREV